jgi:hypothetical protein
MSGIRLLAFNGITNTSGNLKKQNQFYWENKNRIAVYLTSWNDALAVNKSQRMPTLVEHCPSLDGHLAEIECGLVWRQRWNWQHTTSG